MMKAGHIMIWIFLGTIFQAEGMVVMHRQLIGSEERPDFPDASERLVNIIDGKNLFSF